MRIAILEPDGFGGLAHFAFEIAQALAAEGHDISLITSRDFELADLPRRFTLAADMRLWPHRSAAGDGGRPTGPRRLGLFAQRGWRAFVLTREWLKVTGWLRRDRPDMVVCSEVLAPHLGICLWLLRRSGLRLVQVCHEFQYQEREGARFGLGLHRRLSQLVYDQFEVVFFLADAARQGFLSRFRFPADRAIRIRHGGHTSFPPSGGADALRQGIGVLPGEPILLFFGGIRPSKGLDDLIVAFAQSNCRTTARLLIAGRPTKAVDMRLIRDLAGRLGVLDRLVFRDRYATMQETADLFAIATCIVLPYRSATQSAVLHLAYQLGRPVVATAVGGLVEDVAPGKTGLLVPPNDIGALAAALDWMCANPAEAAAMGRHARHLSDTEFAWARTAKTIIDVAALPVRAASASRSTATAAPRAGGAETS